MGHRVTSNGREAVEDYAKAIYSLQRREPGSVSTSALAERLDVSPGAVSSMLKKLAELDLAAYEPYYGVELTAAGERLALEVIRHHRLLESYLAEALGMPWDQVHAEAEVLEHYISEGLEALIADALDNPGRDPHGDPIPNVDLELNEDESRPLATLEPGCPCLFVRISDSDSGMLRYLDRRGIAPGDVVEVIEREPYGGPLRVRIGEDEHALGDELVAAMRVQPLEQAEAGG